MKCEHYQSRELRMRNQSKVRYGVLVNGFTVDLQGLSFLSLTDLWRGLTHSCSGSSRSVGIVKVASILIGWLLMSNVLLAQVDMSAIAKIESSNGRNPLAYSLLRHAVGKYQITQVALDEYNQRNNTNYSKRDMLNDSLNEDVAVWYMTKRIPQMLKHYKKPLTIENHLISYNAGISYVVTGNSLPKETQNYIKRYRRAVAR